MDFMIRGGSRLPNIPLGICKYFGFFFLSKIENISCHKYFIKVKSTNLSESREILGKRASAVFISLFPSDISEWLWITGHP